MPPANKAHEEDRIRALLYGEQKTKKTWWAMRAIEMGFNVHLFDADDGAGILTQYEAVHKPTEEQKARLNIIKVVDKLDSPQSAIFFTALFANKWIVWDEQDKAIRTQPNMIIPEHSHYEINPRKFGWNDIFIMDSWTATAQSVDEKFATEMGIDITSGEKSEEGLFGKDFKFLNWMLSQINAIGCHAIVIGHEQQWQKVKQVKVGNRTDRVAEGPLKTQPISSSGRHSGMMGKHFSDILYFYKAAGDVVRISTKKTVEREGGCRHVPPAEWSWEKLKADGDVPAQLQFSDLCKIANITPKHPVKPSEAVIWYPPGEMPGFPPGTMTAAPVMALGSKPAAIAAPVGLTVGIPTQQPVVAPAVGGNSLVAALQKKS